jgi:hypothetical protein
MAYGLLYVLTAGCGLICSLDFYFGICNGNELMESYHLLPRPLSLFWFDKLDDDCRRVRRLPFFSDMLARVIQGSSEQSSNFGINVPLASHLSGERGKFLDLFSS